MPPRPSPPYQRPPGDPPDPPPGGWSRRPRLRDLRQGALDAAPEPIRRLRLQDGAIQVCQCVVQRHQGNGIAVLERFEVVQSTASAIRNRPDATRRRRLR